MSALLGRVANAINKGVFSWTSGVNALRRLSSDFEGEYKQLEQLVEKRFHGQTDEDIQKAMDEWKAKLIE